MSLTHRTAILEANIRKEDGGGQLALEQAPEGKVKDVSAIRKQCAGNQKRWTNIGKKNQKRRSTFNEEKTGRLCR